MSNWTHVAAVVRVDSLRLFEETDFEKIFGRELRFESPSELWDEADKHPENFLPLGSEGSLRMSVWINPNESHCAAYVVTIWGDLRDHDDPDEIVKWLQNKITEHNLWIRQAVITVNNEWNGNRFWQWENHEDERD